MTAGPGAGRFVWPPRPLLDQHPGDPSPPSGPAARPIDPAWLAGFPELAIDRPGVRGRLGRVWGDVERTWLGLSAAPLCIRAAEAGWAPDPLESYCPRCASSVGPGEAGRVGAGADCPSCRKRRLPWERAIRLGEYHGLLREVIHEIKFTAWRRMGTDIGRLLGRILAVALERDGVDFGRVALVPMPTTYIRRMGRGIDHARVIARGVRDVTGIPLVRALDRSHRRSQLSVPVSRRMANVAGSITPVPGISLGGMTVVVIDDVRTTGATMAAACRALRKGWRATSSPANDRDLIGRVKVWAATVAVAPEPGRRPAEVPRGGVRAGEAEGA